MEIGMTAKAVLKTNKKEIAKQKKNLAKRKIQAMKAIKNSKGFILLNLTDKGIETFLSAGFSVKEVLTAINIMKNISIELLEGIKNVPCDCPSCQNKFMGVN